MEWIFHLSTKYATTLSAIKIPNKAKQSIQYCALSIDISSRNFFGLR